MRILLVCHNFVPAAWAGTEIYVLRLARALAERHSVRVFFPVADPAREAYCLVDGEYDGIATTALVNPQTSCDDGGLDIDPNVRAAFGRLMDRERPDVVHFHHLHRLSADLADESGARSVPVVSTLHDYWYLCRRIHLYVPGHGRCAGPSLHGCCQCVYHPERATARKDRFLDARDFMARLRVLLFRKGIFPSRTNRRLEEYLRIKFRAFTMRNALGRADHVFATSDHLLRRYRRFGLLREETSLLRYGQDAAEYRRFEHPVAAVVRFGYVGSIVEHKGVRVLMEAFAQVPDASLQVWGFESENAVVRDFRSSLTVPPNVRFMGGLRHNEIGRAYSQIDVLIVPSLWEETYAMNIDEARLAGIPVLASRLGGIPEHLVDGQDGYLFEPGNVGQLVQLIRRLAGHPERVESLRQSTPAVPSIQENVENLESTYRRLVKNARSDGEDQTGNPG